jgi:phage head maturation protease
MFEAHDLISDVETIAISSRRYVDAISISFSSAIENSTTDLPLVFILTIAGLLNSVVVQRVLGHGFPDSIMPRAFHEVLEVMCVKVHSLILGILNRVIHIQ